MFPLIDNTANEFILRIRELLTKDTKSHQKVPINQEKTTEDIEINKTSSSNEEYSSIVDSEKLVGGYTADAIVPCAFGLKSNVMYNENDPFAVALHAFYEMSPFNIFEK